MNNNSNQDDNTTFIKDFTRPISSIVDTMKNLRQKFNPINKENPKPNNN